MDGMKVGTSKWIDNQVRILNHIVVRAFNKIPQEMFAVPKEEVLKILLDKLN